jgi:tRNA (adenine22-N1)-methyltransferase
MKRLFSLDPRLSACAGYVRPGCRLADIGTNHGRLPIWLLHQGIVSTAVAADISKDSLLAAQRTARIHGLFDHPGFSLRVSDGLSSIAPEEADDIVIAGMGGLNIAEMFEISSWLRTPDKHLILQPMTAIPDLRDFLETHSFSIINETLIYAKSRQYTVLLCTYGGRSHDNH